jgi:hypothetical protein
MNTPAASADDLIFGWERPGRGKWTIAGFLLASLALHAFGFYIFQIVYPPAVALLPPPGRVSLIAPNSDEGRLLLSWLDAEDPALASTTQAPADGKSLVMPTIQHAPSYLTRQPALKELPPAPPAVRIPSARPPAPVEPPAKQVQTATKIAPTVIRFSPEFETLGSAQIPEMKFSASSPESPQAAQFRIAVNENGEVRHCFLQNSSGNAALDEQARKYLALTRFSILHPLPAVALAKEGPSSILAASLTWGSATIEWGNDIAPSSPPNPSPNAP